MPPKSGRRLVRSLFKRGRTRYPRGTLTGLVAGMGRLRPSTISPSSPLTPGFLHPYTYTSHLTRDRHRLIEQLIGLVFWILVSCLNAVNSLHQLTSSVTRLPVLAAISLGSCSRALRSYRSYPSRSTDSGKVHKWKTHGTASTVPFQEQPPIWPEEAVSDLAALSSKDLSNHPSPAPAINELV